MSKMTDEQRRELRYLAELPDEDIDTGDIPEVSDFTGAVRGRFYRPIKRQVTLRIDADPPRPAYSRSRRTISHAAGAATPVAVR